MTDINRAEEVPPILVVDDDSFNLYGLKKLI
jgi:CheY-like chemotaxis protein